jgi:hypothetical protein
MTSGRRVSRARLTCRDATRSIRAQDRNTTHERGGPHPRGRPLTRRGRTPTDADAELTVLATDEGRALLAEVEAVARPGPADLERWRRRAGRTQAAAALRLAEARRRGTLKFSRAAAMWLDPVGLEQATAEVVARAKAARFAGRSVVDLCCGIGGDSCTLAAVAPAVVAVDADLGMLRRTRWNAEVHGVADRVWPLRADARRFTPPEGWSVHIDPDRRAGAGPRARSLRDYVPGLSRIDALMRMAPGGAVKVGPASDYEECFAADGVEVELVSLGGECKEATVWFGDLATCRRRATRLPEGTTWTDRDGPASPQVSVVGVQEWVFDPDPALVHSGLLDRFAAAHGLGRVASGVDYLAGPFDVDTPFLAAFRVIETLPLDLKKLARLVRDRGLGPLEIKVRGLGLTPEQVRPRLRPPGPQPATLLLVGGTGPARAIVARRRSTSMT